MSHQEAKQQEEPKRSPRGAQEEPKRNPRGAQEEPRKEPRRSPREAQEKEPKRSPGGAQEEPRRSPGGAKKGPKIRQKTRNNVTSNLLHTAFFRDKDMEEKSSRNVWPGALGRLAGTAWA